MVNGDPKKNGGRIEAEKRIEQKEVGLKIIQVVIYKKKEA